MNPDLMNIAAALREISSTLQEMQTDISDIADAVKESRLEVGHKDG